ncbi:MAG: response regulator [Flavobacteriales bacterium]|nr:response regulator [Bacteroidota bacterium]MCB9240107.1 response regulator [Flavobacteriales bacterium]
MLFVDGNAIHRMYTKMVLNLMKIEVDTAAETSVAIDLIQKGSYSLILLDLDELGLNGFEVARTIRKKDPTIPIIGITDVADVNIMFKALQYGMNTCIPRTDMLETLSFYAKGPMEKNVA